MMLRGAADDLRLAQQLMHSAYVDADPPQDPWEFLLRGDARLWPTYMARLRLALQ